MASRSSNGNGCPSPGSTFRDEPRSVHRHGGLGFSTSHKARQSWSQTNKGRVSDFIYFDNPVSALGHFAAFVAASDNNLANSLSELHSTVTSKLSEALHFLLSEEKPSGGRAEDASPLSLFVSGTRATAMGSWQVISTITITPITGVINNSSKAWQ